ncbi:MAG TPA: arylsulfotransferase family protein [Solirubrobacterales bacterium]|nr:arylsulfotransferase family protein [Solirubrobacterales bacterium]
MKRLALLAIVFALGPGALFAGCGEGDVSTSAPGRSSPRATGLPDDFPRWRFESIRAVPPGLFVVTFSNPEDGRPWVIVFDHEGKPRWWFNPGTRAFGGQILSDGNLVWARSFGNGYGLDPRMAHEVRSESGKLVRLVRTKGSIVDGHEFLELANGNALLDTYVPETADLRRVGGPKRAAIVSAEVQEVDRAGRVLWRWSSRGHIGLRETGRWWRNVLSNSRRRLQGRQTFDPVHINSIEPRGRDEIIISTRHTDAVYGIDRASGEINWKLGGTPTGKSLRVVGDPATKLLGGQHDARVDSRGRLTIFDNGKDRPRLPRVVFYRLDLERGRAIYRGQLNDPEVTESHCCGSARELPGGGWIVSWGDNPLVTGFDREGRIAFRLHLPASTFRAVPVPPGATDVDRLRRGLAAMREAAAAPETAAVERKRRQAQKPSPAG